MELVVSIEFQDSAPGAKLGVILICMPFAMLIIKLTPVVVLEGRDLKMVGQ